MQNTVTVTVLACSIFHFTSNCSHFYPFLLKCWFLKQKEGAFAWLNTEDLLCNCSSSVINTCLCCFSSPSTSHIASLALLFSTFSSFLLSLYNFLSRSLILTYILSTHPIWDFFVRWVFDRWRRFHRDTVSPLQSAVSPGWCMGEIGAPTSH